MELLGSLYLSYKTRRPCILEFDEGAWLHHYPGVTLADTRIRENPPTPERYEKHTREVFFPYYTPSEGDVVIDVGAGVGPETIVCSNLVGESGLVYAIEAHPLVFACLQKVCERNSLENTRLFQLALGDERGELTISDDLGQHISNNIFSAEGDVAVEVDTIDRWVISQGIQEIDFLKMNIEGAEKLVIKEAKETLTITQNVAISCHDFKADRTGDDAFRTKALVAKALSKAGFELLFRRDDERPWVRDTIYGRRNH